MQEAWYTKTCRGEEGPFTFAQLIAAVQRGRLLRTDTVRQEHSPWRFVDSVRGLQEFIRRGQTQAEPRPSSIDRGSLPALATAIRPAGPHDIDDALKSGQLTENDQAAAKHDSGRRKAAGSPQVHPVETPAPPKIRQSPWQLTAPRSASESWLYRCGGKTHGPIRWLELLDLFGHSAELAREAQICRQDDEKWVAFDVRGPEACSSTAEATSRAEGNASFGRRVEEAGTSGSNHAPHASALSSKTKPRRRFGEMLRDNALVVAAIVAWLSLNAGALSIWADPYPLERQYLSELHQIIDDAQLLQDHDASPDDWKEFRTRSTESLKGMVLKLKKAAGPSKPLQQQLLWAARDEVPRILGPKSRDTEKWRKEVDAHLKAVESAIALRGARPPQRRSPGNSLQ